MKYIKQLLIILAFSFLGEALQAVIPLPIPAAIYGLVLLLIALCTGLLKPAHIADTDKAKCVHHVSLLTFFLS